MGEQQQMTPGEIAIWLMDAGVDTVGSPRAIADEAIQDFIERVAELHRSQIGPLDVDDLREAAREFAGQDDFTRLAAVGPLSAWSTLLQSPPQGDITVTKGGLITVGRCAQCHASGPGPVDIQFDGQHLQLCKWHARRLSEALAVVLGIPPQQSVMVPVSVRQSDSGWWWAEVAISRHSRFCESGDTPEEAIAKVQAAFDAWAAGATPK